MEIALLENGWWEEDGRAGFVLHQRGEPPPLSVPDCTRLLIVVNGGAARQVDYKVTINNPFQACQKKLWVVFVLYVWVQFVPHAMICIRVVAFGWLLAIIPAQEQTSMNQTRSITCTSACHTYSAPSYVREWCTLMLYMSSSSNIVCSGVTSSTLWSIRLKLLIRFHFENRPALESVQSRKLYMLFYDDLQKLMFFFWSNVKVTVIKVINWFCYLITIDRQ